MRSLSLSADLMNKLLLKSFACLLWSKYFYYCCKFNFPCQIALNISMFSSLSACIAALWYAGSSWYSRVCWNCVHQMQQYMQQILYKLCAALLRHCKKTSSNLKLANLLSNVKGGFSEQKFDRWIALRWSISFKNINNCWNVTFKFLRKQFALFLHLGFCAFRVLPQKT